MPSGLLIFLRINLPQGVKSTAKFGGLATIWGGGLCPPVPAWNRHCGWPAPPSKCGGGECARAVPRDQYLDAGELGVQSTQLTILASHRRAVAAASRGRASWGRGRGGWGRSGPGSVGAQRGAAAERLWQREQCERRTTTRPQHLRLNAEQQTSLDTTHTHTHTHTHTSTPSLYRLKDSYWRFFLF